MRNKYEFLLVAFVTFILTLTPYLLILWIWGHDSAVLIVNGTGSLLLSLYVGWYIFREYKSSADQPFNFNVNERIIPIVTIRS